MFIPKLAYHKIQRNFDFSFSRSSPAQFERQIEFLYNNGFQTISISDYIKRKNCAPKSIILTFDDSYASAFDLAFPILSKYNFTATIFVLTGFVGEWNRWDYNSFIYKSRHCDWNQIKTLLSEGWEIGSHTSTHEDLTRLPKRQLWDEVYQSKDLLENQIQKSIDIISYPFGKFNNQVIEMVQKAGYKAGCTLGYNYPSNEIFPYALFRRGVYSFEPFRLFKLKIKNNQWSHYDDVKQKIISSCSQGTIWLRHFKSN